MRRLHATDLWFLVVELPEGSRVEYQVETRRGEHYERFNDPLNPHRSHSPMGGSSVCFAAGYETPPWALPDPDARPGELVDFSMPSRALGREASVQVYLPARFRRTATYPLLVVHDGSEFMQYAAARTALDNLIHSLDVAETVVAFTDPGDRLVEYADSAAHARFVNRELLPRLEQELPLVGRRAGRCLLGASFGAVASLATAARARDTYGSLVLMSGLVRVDRPRQRPRRRAGLRPGRRLRQPLPGTAARVWPTGCTSAAGCTSRSSCTTGRWCGRSSRPA